MEGVSFEQQPTEFTREKLKSVIEEVGKDCDTHVTFSDNFKPPKKPYKTRGFESIPPDKKEQVDMIIEACIQYLLRPYITDKFKEDHLARLRWVADNLKPQSPTRKNPLSDLRLRTAAFKFFKKNKLSSSVVTSLISGIRMLAEMPNTSESSEVLNYAKSVHGEMLRRSSKNNDDTHDIAAKTPGTPQSRTPLSESEKKSASAEYANLLKEFLGNTEPSGNSQPIAAGATIKLSGWASLTNQERKEASDFYSEVCRTFLKKAGILEDSQEQQKAA